MDTERVTDQDRGDTLRHEQRNPVRPGHRGGDGDLVRIAHLVKASPDQFLWLLLSVENWV